MTLKTWWKKRNYWQKYILTFVLLYFFIGINYLFFGLGNADYESHPKEPYLCFSIDVERYCSFTQLVFDSFTITPLMMTTFIPIYFLIFNPVGIFRLLEFDYSEMLFILPILFYLSIPITLFISIAKSKAKGKKEKILSFISITIIIVLIGNIITQHILYYRPYYVLTYIGREPCNYFSQTEYDFNNISIVIGNQQCKQKNDKMRVYFTLEFDTKKDDILTWNLGSLRVNEHIQAYYDDNVNINPYTIFPIKRYKNFFLYLDLNKNQTYPDLKITDSGINVRELREWNWENSSIKDRNNRNYGHSFK